MFVIADCYNAAISSIPKCGSQSIERAATSMLGGRVITNQEALEHDERVMFIRHPLTRLHSCYSFFSWLEHNKTGYDEFIPVGILTGSGEIDDYHRFIDYVIENSESHWSSQIDQVTEGGVFLPTVVHRFEHIQEHWQKYAQGALPWDNAFSQRLADDYRVSELEEIYKEDTALWARSG